MISPAKKAAKQLSADAFKSLREVAARATAAAELAPTLANHTAAHDAHHAASMAGSRHYMSYGGGIGVHDKADENRRASMHHENEAKKIADAEQVRLNAEHAERIKDPKWQGARHAANAERLDSQAGGYRRTGYPGWSDTHLSESRGHYAKQAIGEYERAHALHPEGSYGGRADEVRKAHAEHIARIEAKEAT